MNCKLYGITGRPASLTDVIMEKQEPDLSQDGEGSDITHEEDVLELGLR